MNHESKSNDGRRSFDPQRVAAVKKEWDDAQQTFSESRQMLEDYERIKERFAELTNCSVKANTELLSHLSSAAEFRKRLDQLEAEERAIEEETTRRIEELANRLTKFTAPSPISAGTDDHAPRAFALLRAFRWFCDKENKENLEMILGDLKRDCEEMRIEGRSCFFIRRVVFWRVIFGAVLPIVSDAVIRFLQRARKISDLLTTKNSG